MIELKSGDLLSNRYTILKELGRGGFGRTYIAQDIQMPRHPKCVVKQLKTESNHHRLMETARRLFETEAKTLDLLGNHSQIPQLLAHFQEGEEFFVVQELISGESLDKELKLGQPWPEQRIVETLQDILEILAFIHNNNVIHRDIKPENIIRRSSDQKLVLVDFGSVKRISGQLSSSLSGNVTPTVSIGTPGYMPTEQSRGKPRPNSDIYALGVIGIRLTTGLSLSQLQEDQETGELIWKPWAKARNSLIVVLEKMTKYHFKDRYQSSQDVLSDIAALELAGRDTVVDYGDGNIANPPFNIENAPSFHDASVIVEATSIQPQHSERIPQIKNADIAQETSVSLSETTLGHGSRVPLGANRTSQSTSNRRKAVASARLFDNIKLSGILGSGSWLLALGIASFFSNVLIISGAWLIAVSFCIFGLSAKTKNISDKILWLAITIICIILSILVIPSNFSLVSLLSPLNLWGGLVTLLISIFSFVLTFILLTLVQSLSN